MSRPLASTLEVASLLTPLTNQQAVNPPTSTAQIGAQLTNTCVNGSDRPEPVLSKKDVPKSPFDASADSSSVSGSVVDHCAPENRAQSASTSLASTPTTTPGLADKTLTMTDLTEAASKGDAIAQFELAKLFYQGLDVAVNYEEALKWYTQSAEQGNFNAQYNLALMYYKGVGIDKDRTKAVFWLKKSAVQGFAQAQYRLGLMYGSGKVGEKNDSIYAAFWHGKAAEQNLPEAQFELGNLYLFGHSGLEKDHFKAIDLFFRAADQGYCDAQIQLGHLFRDGFVVPQDFDTAVHWFRQAAYLGDMAGQGLLAGMYIKGHGVKQSDEEAVFWYAKAAEQGSNSAMEYLAHAYKDGKGVNKDLNRSIYLQMRSRLNNAGTRIDASSLDISLSAGLIEFIAQNINEQKEFKNVTRLDCLTNTFSDDEILGICALIRKNLRINYLFIEKEMQLAHIELITTQLRLLTEALESNTQLINLIFENPYGGKLIESQDISFLARNLFARNLAIAELRKYVQDLQPIITDSLPLDPLLIIVDNIIVSNMMSGKSKDETKNVIDELLISASH